MIVAFVWFGYPITVMLVMSVTTTSLYLAATRNGRPRSARQTIVTCSVLAFAVPTIAEFLGTTVSCGDGFSWKSRTPSVLVGGLALAGFAMLIGLALMSGSASRIWLLPLICPVALAVGLVAESFFAVAGLVTYCEDHNPAVLLLQVMLAPVASVLAVFGMLHGRRVDSRAG